MAPAPAFSFGRQTRDDFRVLDDGQIYMLLNSAKIQKDNVDTDEGEEEVDFLIAELRAVLDERKAARQ